MARHPFPTVSSTRCQTITCMRVCCRSSFRSATLIHVRRDARDIALSCWMTHFRSIRWANDFDHLVGPPRGAIAGSRTTGGRCLPARVHEVFYEQLVTNFNREARRLIDLRSRLGAGLSSISPDAPASPYRERHSGKAAALRQVGCAMEAL